MTHLDDAQARQKELERLVKQVNTNFLDIGEQLYLAREKRDWIALAMDSFEYYVMEVLPDTSYNVAQVLIGIHEHIVLGELAPRDELVAIGGTKLRRLLPIARKGELTPEWMDKASVLTDADLRRELGHILPEGSSGDWYACPECGSSFPLSRARKVTK